MRAASALPSLKTLATADLSPDHATLATFAIEWWFDSSMNRVEELFYFVADDNELLRLTGRTTNQHQPPPRTNVY